MVNLNKKNRKGKTKGEKRKGKVNKEKKRN